MKHLLPWGAVLSMVLLLLSCQTEQTPDYQKISVADYEDKVAAYWYGQLIGNHVGLSHEFQYVKEHGPDRTPVDYTWPDWKGEDGMVMSMIDHFKYYDGAFSDDDTDIEYMYLMYMEKYGTEPTYEQLAEAWKRHIKTYIWVANRSALGLMNYGYMPPYSGRIDFNRNWFQIDPQLVNEIWAATAPGMVDYAAAKSDWAAKITNDDFGTDATVHYGAMLSAAFFEKDIHKLLDIGNAALPEGNRFVEVVQDMRALHQKYPDDWRAARVEMVDKYLTNEPVETATIVGSILNGACGILALLYGDGDFQTTLDVACLIGYDADNQAATMSALIGIIEGTEGIPTSLLVPEIEGWEKPFNDFYKTLTRSELPDVAITEQISRIAAQGEKIILEQGGKKVTEDGVDYYLINPDAAFIPPAEFAAIPPQHLTVGEAYSFDFYVGGKDPVLSVSEGSLPVGIQLTNNDLMGIPTEAGTYEVTLKLEGEPPIERKVTLFVHEDNLATTASSVITPENSSENSDRLNDRLIAGHSSFYQTGSPKPEARDWIPEFNDTYVSAPYDEPEEMPVGYMWDESQDISTLVVYMGAGFSKSGWYKELTVEYLNDAGEWEEVEDLNITPDLVGEPTLFTKPEYVPYQLSFSSVNTKGIRIMGIPGGAIEPRVEEIKYEYFLMLSEIEVYQ
ncbi:MAG: ADP-ribosylglycohydrolase family protein [Bacteroidota bacterium]